MMANVDVEVCSGLPFPALAACIYGSSYHYFREENPLGYSSKHALTNFCQLVVEKLSQEGFSAYVIMRACVQGSVDSLVGLVDMLDLPNEFWEDLCTQLHQFSLHLHQVCLQLRLLYKSIGSSYGAGLELLSGVATGSRNIAGDSKFSPSVPLVNLGNAPYEAYQEFIRLGGRGFDTALSYGDHQHLISMAIRQSGIKRKEFFVTSKVPCCPPDDFAKFFVGVCNSISSQNIRARAKLAVDNVGLDYLDLLLVHQPCNSTQQTIEAYLELEPLVHSHGSIRALGVSNFNAALLVALVRQVSVMPAVIQNGFNAIRDDGAIERHGGDLGTVALSELLNIQYVAFSPLGGWSSGSTHDVLSHPTIMRIARQYLVSPAQVALRWLVQQGIFFVTSSSGNVAHLQQDLFVQNFTLAQGDMRAIEGTSTDLMSREPTRVVYHGPRAEALWGTTLVFYVTCTTFLERCKRMILI